MPLEIASQVRLKGKTDVPGDERLTLGAIAAAMYPGCEIVLKNPSPSPAVDSLLKFLGQYGAASERTAETVIFRGAAFSGDVTVDTRAPDAVLHTVVCQAVFAADSVRIESGAADRSYAVNYIADLLKRMGVREELITADEDDLVIGRAEFSPPDIVQVSSAWAFEASAAAAAAAGKPVVISYPPGAVDHVCDLLTFLGFRIEPAAEADSEHVELTKRLSRAAGKRSREIRTISLSGLSGGTLDIPGDTTLAAAVCASAAILERSDVTIGDVLWPQGRRGFFEALKRMKAAIEWTPLTGKRTFPAARIRIKWSRCEGIHLTAEQARTMMPELLLLGAVGAFASGKTVTGDPPDVPGFGRDVYRQFTRGLELFGAHSGDYADGIAVQGKPELRGNRADAAGNADVALALTAAALNTAVAAVIDNADTDMYPLDAFLRIIDTLSGGSLI